MRTVAPGHRRTAAVAPGVHVAIGADGVELVCRSDLAVGQPELLALVQHESARHEGSEHIESQRAGRSPAIVNAIAVAAVPCESGRCPGHVVAAHGPQQPFGQVRLGRTKSLADLGGIPPDMHRRKPVAAVHAVGRQQVVHAPRVQVICLAMQEGAVAVADGAPAPEDVLALRLKDVVEVLKAVPLLPARRPRRDWTELRI